MMRIDWANTPGGYYALAYWFAACLLIWFSPKRLQRKKSGVLITLFFGISLYLLMTITHGSSQWLFVPFMLFFILLIWANIYFVCKYNAVTAFYFAIRAFLMGEFIASLEWMIFYHETFLGFVPLNRLTEVLTFVLVDGMLLFVFYHLEKRNRKLNSQISISRQEILSAAVIAVAIFVVSNVNYVLSDTRGTELVLSDLFLVRTLVDLGGVAILYAYHAQLGGLKAGYEMERLQDMLAMQYNNYAMLEQSIATINQKYHDLKYQIALLKSEANASASLEYLEQMEKEIKSYEAQNKTGNKVLDTILTGKSLYCQNHWIELTSVADGSALDFMNPMDISTLFGNMLDNAIESVEKIEAKEKRLIHLAVTKQKGFLRIRQENCCVEEPEFENGMPKTTKADKNYHGFGLKSIKNTVKKYGGSTSIHMENGWFELRILIPLPKEAASERKKK